jgi:hypothetical protein
MRRMMLMLLVVAALALLLSCGGDRSAVASAPVAQALRSDAVGVPECDAYVKSFLTCIESKVPAISRATYQGPLHQAIAGWRQAASTADGRAALAAACSQAQQAAGKVMQAYGCTF